MGAQYEHKLGACGTCGGAPAKASDASETGGMLFVAVSLSSAVHTDKPRLKVQHYGDFFGAYKAFGQCTRDGRLICNDLCDESHSHGRELFALYI